MIQEIKESRAVLVGLIPGTKFSDECDRSLDELARLLETAGGREIARVVQIKDAPNPRTLIGSGKVKEIAELCKNNDVDLVVFDTELTPSQIRNLEEDMSSIHVIDRSMLILDIFALHAVSGEGKLQVELAQLKYTAPRLIGKGAELSRQEGRIGTRGPGESKLETDRRHLRRRITALEEKLSEMEANRATARASRDRSGLIKIAIVGYTNEGKSTLLNYLTDAGVLSEDKLFATLDPTTRRLELPNGESVLLTDTVGFIRKLPHHLIKAFRSTLEEAVLADVLVIVCDITDEECYEHLEVTRELLSDLGASDKPTLLVYNKCDRSEIVRAERENTVYISAKTGEGIDTLLSVLVRISEEGKRKCTLCFSYAESAAVSSLYQVGSVEQIEYRDDTIVVTAVLDAKGRGLYEKYIQK